MTRIKNMKGFTLIELVVVIVIIGILAAVAAFAYSSVVENTRKADVETAGSQLAKSYAANVQLVGAATAAVDAASDVPAGYTVTTSLDNTSALAIAKGDFCVVVDLTDLNDGYVDGAVGTVEDAAAVVDFTGADHTAILAAGCV